MALHRILCTIAPPVLAIGAVAGIPVTADATAAPGWRDVPLPTLAAPSHLLGVTATGPNNAWAVGAEANGKRAVVLRWDGRAWRRHQIPAGTSPEVTGIASAGPGNAWVVARSTTNGHPIRSLHWDGTRWRAVDFDFPADRGEVYKVAAAPRGAAWAIGYVGDGAAVFRFTRGRWITQRVPLPKGTWLESVAARSNDDVWITGQKGVAEKPTQFAMRWNGTAWLEVRAPAKDAALREVTPVSATSVWTHQTESIIDLATGLLHWNGARWRHIPIPFRVDVHGKLADDGQGGVWVARQWVVDPPNLQVRPAKRTFYQRYNRGTWTTLPGPFRPLALYVVSSDLTRVPGTNTLWSVGVRSSGPQGRDSAALIERYS